MYTTPVKIGIVGMGNISSVYLRNCTRAPTSTWWHARISFGNEHKGAAHRIGVPRAGTVDELLNNPESELVVNLTIPQAHAAVAIAALEHGKSVYNEKPLALTLADA